TAPPGTPTPTLPLLRSPPAPHFPSTARGSTSSGSLPARCESPTPCAAPLLAPRQIRHIQTRDDQHASRRRQQYIQRCLVVSNHVFNQQPQVRAGPRRSCRICFLKPPLNGVDLAQSLRPRYALLQQTNHAKFVIAYVLHRCRRHFVMNRQPHLRRLVR